MNKKIKSFLISCCMLFPIPFLSSCNDNPTQEKQIEFKLISNNLSLGKGESKNIIVECNDSSKISYESSNNQVACVSDNGFVTGVMPGDAFIFVKYNNEEKICKVTVKKSDSSIVIGNEKIDLTVGSEKEWTATVYRNGVEVDEPVTWQISNLQSCIFTYSGNTAKFTGTETGDFTLTVTSSNLSTTCSIRVVEENAQRLSSPILTSNCNGIVTWESVTNAHKYSVFLDGNFYKYVENCEINLNEFSSHLKSDEGIFVGVQALACDNYHFIDSLNEITVISHSYVKEKLGSISCKNYGNIKYTCSTCEHCYEEVNVLTEHTWEDNKCSTCGIDGIPLSITDGVLNWKMQPGATSYNVLINGKKVANTSNTNIDITDCFDLSKGGNYDIDVSPVGTQSMFVTTHLNVVLLDQSNFSSILNNSNDVYSYFVLTENINLSHEYNQSTLHDADGFLPPDQLCSSPIIGLKNSIFEGNGFKITTSFLADATKKTNNGWEIFSGLFGFLDNALVKDVNADMVISQPGHLHKIFSTGALVAVMKDDTVIKNCYIKSRFNLESLSDYNVNGGIGAVSGIVREVSSVPVITNCIVDSSISVAGVSVGAPKALVGIMDSNVLINQNAYIINEKIPTKYSEISSTYLDVFMSWTLRTQNMLYSRLTDLMFGKNGAYCDYYAKGQWDSNWYFNCNPSTFYGVSKVFESSEWKDTTFKYDDVLGITLFGKPLIEAKVDRPFINKGNLYWTGSASKFNIYANDNLLTSVTNPSLNLVEALNYEPGSYQIRIEPSEYNEMITYENITFEIVALSQSNFIEALTNSNSNKYYYLTENINLTTSYIASNRTSANGKYSENLLYAPISKFNSVLDGRGFKVTISYDGGTKIDGGWEVFGGLFGYTENAVIKNLNYNFTAQLNGHVHQNLPGGALIGVMGSNTVIQDCYIKSRFNVWNSVDVKGIGALAGKIFAGSSGSVVKNNIISSIVMHNNSQQESPDRLISNIGENISMNNNIYIINKTLPNTVVTGGIYDEAFMAWGVDAFDNWLFASLDDFLNGSGHKCTYHGSTNWSREWALFVTPAQKIYLSEGWNDSTFSYIEGNGMALCGKPI